MKQRTKDYIARIKSFKALLKVPASDLKTILIAEHDASRNIIVKKDIRKMLDQLEEGVEQQQ